MMLSVVYHISGKFTAQFQADVRFFLQLQNPPIQLTILEKHLIEQKPDTMTGPLAEIADRNPNRVPWTAPQTFRAVLLTLIPWVALNLFLNSLGGTTPANQPLTMAEDFTGAIVAFIFTALIEGAFLLAPIYYARIAIQVVREAIPAGIRVISEALGLRRFNLARTLPWIIGLMVLIFAFDELYTYAINVLHIHIMTNDQVVLQQSKLAPLTTYGVLLGSILIAPFCEELFFRGFVLPGLLKEMSPIWAVLISAALFAIAHVDPGSFLPLFIIGIALGFLRLRSGSTWAGISLHMLNNTLAATLIVLAMHGINLPF